MNYLNPDPNQKIIELEHLVSANDEYLQKLEQENDRLRKVIARIKDIILHAYEPGE